MQRKGSNQSILRIFDEQLVKDAVDKVKGILVDPKSKNSEILNAADKIIKFKFMFQDAVRRQTLDKIEIEDKELRLEERRLRLEAIRGVANPNTPPEQARAYSKVFERSFKPEGYEEDEEDLKEA